MTEKQIQTREYSLDTFFENIFKSKDLAQVLDENFLSLALGSYYTDSEETNIFCKNIQESKLLENKKYITSIWKESNKGYYKNIPYNIKNKMKNPITILVLGLTDIQKSAEYGLDNYSIGNKKYKITDTSILDDINIDIISDKFIKEILIKNINLYKCEYYTKNGKMKECIDLLESDKSMKSSDYIPFYIVFYKTKEYLKLLKHCKNHLKTLKKEDKDKLIECYSRLVVVYNKLGNKNQAQKYRKKLIQTVTRKKKNFILGESYMHLHNASVFFEDYMKSIKYCKKFLNLVSISSKSKSDLSFGHYWLGIAYSQTKKYLLARKHLYLANEFTKKSKRFWHEKDIHEELVYVLDKLSSWNYKIGQPVEVDLFFYVYFLCKAL